MISSWSCRVNIPLLHTCWTGWTHRHLTGILRLPCWQGCIHRSWLRLPHLGNRDYVILQHSDSPTWTWLTLNHKLPYLGTWLWELSLQIKVILLHHMRYIYPIPFQILPVLQTKLYRWYVLLTTGASKKLFLEQYIVIFLTSRQKEFQNSSTFLQCLKPLQVWN